MHCDMRLDPNITIVIATHNRPDCLRVAVESALRQTHTRWRMLVLGDGCDARTPKALKDIVDPRVLYIDLPVRFGEQSGPNSVGMSLAITEWIAFLNHDDLWLPDHLEHALQKLTQTGADFFLGRAIFTEANATPAQIVSEHRLWQAFRTGELFEPASRWVFQRSLVERVGLWRMATTLYRTPIEDWLLRAWRKNVIAVGGDVVTVVRVQNTSSSGAPTYEQPARAQELLLQRLAAVPLEQFRAEMCQVRHKSRGPRKPRPLATRLKRSLNRGWRLLLLNKAFSALFRSTGWDAFVLLAKFEGGGKGSFMRGALLRRVGAPLPEAPDLAGAIAAARNLAASSNGTGKCQ